jgi:hypothetical protein
MPKNEIVIDLDSRIVSVYAAQPEKLNVILVDWDSEGVDPRSPNMVRLRCGRQAYSAFVLGVPVLPLYQLAGSDTEDAIERAEQQGALTERAGAAC